MHVLSIVLFCFSLFPDPSPRAATHYWGRVAGSVRGVVWGNQNFPFSERTPCENLN